MPRGNEPSYYLSKMNNGDGASSKAGESVVVPALGTNGIRLADEQPSAQFRPALVSFLAAAIGLVAGVIRTTFANRAVSEEDFREGEDREWFHHRVTEAQRRILLDVSVSLW